MEEEINPIKDYKNYKKRKPIKMNKKRYFLLFIIVYMILSGIMLYLEKLNEYCVKDFDVHEYSTLDEISYNTGSKIPTLYKYTKYQNAISTKYRYEDDRFGYSVTTIEISFSDIPEEYLDTYKNALIQEGYSYVADWDGDEVYTKAEKGIHPQTLKTEDFNSFIIVGKTRVIYGVLLGDYERIFK